jgi:hypothetical protein
LAYFGYPRAHEDDAERTVRAGLDIIAAVARLKTHAAEPLAVRIGIATGVVVVGEGALREHAVVGDTPNLAARLQALAEPGTIVVAASTRRLLRDLFRGRCSVASNRLIPAPAALEKASPQYAAARPFFSEPLRPRTRASAELSELTAWQHTGVTLRRPSKAIEGARNATDHERINARPCSDCARSNGPVREL